MHNSLSVAPRLTVEPNDKYVSPGSTVQFTCEADGVPQPIITWYKDGQAVFPFGGFTLSLHGKLLNETVFHIHEKHYYINAIHSVNMNLYNNTYFTVMDFPRNHSRCAASETFT